MREKIKYTIYSIPILIILGVFFSTINLIITTLKFEPSKNNYSKTNRYSYIIFSSDDKVLTKLSRKFEVDNGKDKIPFFLKYAFISAEDKRFLKHNGIDLIGLSRAFVSNIKSGFFKEGGSTII